MAGKCQALHVLPFLHAGGSVACRVSVHANLVRNLAHAGALTRAAGVAADGVGAGAPGLKYLESTEGNNGQNKLKSLGVCDYLHVQMNVCVGVCGCVKETVNVAFVKDDEILLVYVLCFCSLARAHALSLGMSMCA